MITISSDTTYKVINEEPKSVDNVKKINVEDGKITIKIKMDSPEGVIDDIGKEEITLRFITIKEGETTIEFNGGSAIQIKSAEVKVTKQEQEGKTEITATSNEETADANKTTESKVDNTYFYSSLIINILQLIAIIVLIVVGRKKKKMA